MKKAIVFLGGLTLATIGSAADPAEAPGLKLTGFFNYRYEWTQNPIRLSEDAMVIDTNGDSIPDHYITVPSPEGSAAQDAKSETQTTLWMNLDNQFDGKTRFHAIAVAQHLGGRTTLTNLSIYEAYVAAKFGPAEVAVGRFLADSGLGLVVGAPFMDGLHVSAGNDLVRGNVFVTKWGGAWPVESKAQSSHMTFAIADLKVTPVKGLTLSASVFRDMTTDDSKNLYKAYKFGFEYQYAPNNIPWCTVMAEFGRNTAGMAKTMGQSQVLVDVYGTEVPVPVGEAKTPKALIVGAKVLGAHPFMPGTGGIQVQYRNADAGFDQMAMCNPMVVNNPFNWMSPSGGGIMDNYKGVEVTGEVTLLPRTILKASYGFMKAKDMNALLCLNVYDTQGNYITTDSRKYFTAQIFYIF